MHQWEANEVMDLRSKLLDNILIGGKQGERELLMRAASAAHETKVSIPGPTFCATVKAKGFEECWKNYRKHEAFRTRLKRSRMATDAEEAFVYVPMNGSKKDCPNHTNSTRAEQSLQGVAQMVFVWMVVSMFNVVAKIVVNINNNANNNNNNNNNINLNAVSTKDTQISQNTNIANTVDIMLPPPAGRRRK